MLLVLVMKNRFKIFVQDSCPLWMFVCSWFVNKTVNFFVFNSFCHQEAIFRTLAAILHLGNVEFSPGKEHDSSVLKDQKSSFHLQMAASLLMYVIKM